MRRLTAVRFFPLLVLGAALVPAAARAGDPKPGRVEFNRDVRPILADKCFACHGPDKGHRKADLRLDTADALKSGAVAPGKPDESELIARVTTDRPARRMPPPKTGKTLTPAEVAVLRRWVEQGAEYQPHWSYAPPRRPPLPDVKDVAWARGP